MTENSSLLIVFFHIETNICKTEEEIKIMNTYLRSCSLEYANINKSPSLTSDKDFTMMTDIVSYQFVN